MTRTLKIAIAVIALPFLAASCNKADDAAEERIARPAVKKESVKAAEAVEKPVYKESGETPDLRNPFQSHLIVARGGDSPVKVKGPLECCEVSSFKLLAVVVGSSDPEGYALIQAPDTKRYVIRKGDALGTREGRVVKFTSKAVIVREVSRDDEGKVRSSEEIELSLPEKQA